MLYTPMNGKMNAGRQYVKELRLGEWSSPNGLKEPDRAKKYLNKVSWQPIPFMTPWSPDSQLELPQTRQRARPLAPLTSHWKGAHPSREVGDRTLNLFSLKEGNFWTRVHSGQSAKTASGWKWVRRTDGIPRHPWTPVSSKRTSLSFCLTIWGQGDANLHFEVTYTLCENISVWLV